MATDVDHIEGLLDGILQCSDPKEVQKTYFEVKNALAKLRLKTKGGESGVKRSGEEHRMSDMEDDVEVVPTLGAA